MRRVKLNDRVTFPLYLDLNPLIHGDKAPTQQKEEEEDEEEEEEELDEEEREEKGRSEDQDDEARPQPRGRNIEKKIINTHRNSNNNLNDNL